MYYHPMTWPWIRPDARGDSERVEAVLDVLIEGIVGQQRLQLEAMKAIALAPVRHARALLDAKDAGELAARSVIYTCPSGPKLFELAYRAGGLAARTLRELHELLRPHPSGGTTRTGAGPQATGCAEPTDMAAKPQAAIAAALAVLASNRAATCHA
jgi:hypothetical protein